MSNAVGFSVVCSFIALVLSVVAIFINNRNAVVQHTLAMHSVIFRDDKTYKLLYRFKDEFTGEYYFSSETRGAPGNFVGSAEEVDVDLLLERLNFVCMWLLKLPPNDEEELFKKYVHRLYESKFYQQYFSFLDKAESVKRSGPFFSFIHKFADNRLGLNRPSVAYPTSEKDVGKLA